MEEAIERVLSDETYTTNEERVEAIKKELAKLVIPKDKFNDVNSKLKASEANLTSLQTEFEDFKKTKMTDDEKREAEIKQFENDKKANAIERSSLAVQRLLLENGIEVKDDDSELKDTLANIVSEDYDKSLNLAKSFVSLLNKTKEETQKETTTKLLNDTPRPIGGVESSSTVSKLDQLNTAYKKALDDKNVVEQVRLMREIQEEQSKMNI